MNKINVVDNKIIPFDNTDVILNNNIITFTNNGDYYLEYITSNNVNITISVEDNVCVHLFEYSNNNDINTNITYNLGKNSSLIISKFYYNDNTNEEINIYLNKKNANIKYNFSSISKNHDNYLINIYHNDSTTNSDIFNRTIAKENSSNTFDINSYVENKILDCYLNQSTKIITLGDSNNKINPNMFTHDNSVTAIHASVIGNVNEEELFYLMSRGISYNEAIKIIIKGIILSNINPNMEYREKILNILEEVGGE
mgnify:FL=1